MIKVSILQKDINFNVHISQQSIKIAKAKVDRTTKRNRQITIMVGDFNTPLMVIDRSSRQKISEDTVELCITIGQLDLIDIYRILHPKRAEYTFFSKKIDTCHY